MFEYHEKSNTIFENTSGFNGFRHFTKFGNKLEHEVWPALLLHDHGPVIVKGVAQLRY
jgi:hypothetical protein